MQAPPGSSPFESKCPGEHTATRGLTSRIEASVNKFTVDLQKKKKKKNLVLRVGERCSMQYTRNQVARVSDLGHLGLVSSGSGMCKYGHTLHKAQWHFYGVSRRGREREREIERD